MRLDGNYLSQKLAVGLACPADQDVAPMKGLCAQSHRLPLPLQEAEDTLQNKHGIEDRPMSREDFITARPVKLGTRSCRKPADLPMRRKESLAASLHGLI